MKFHWIIWIPRTLMIILAVFMLMFSLDVFEMDGSIWQKIAGFCMHSIPSFLMLITLIVTWKKPFFGGIFFFVFCILMTVFFQFYLYWDRLLIFTLPLLLGGILFMLAHYLKPKQLTENQIKQEDTTQA